MANELLLLPLHPVGAGAVAFLPADPRPLEALVLDEHLNGQHGTNRAPGPGQLAANNDLDAIAAWLDRVRGSPRTFANYRKEAERLLLWALIAQAKPLSSLTHEDLLAYRSFMTDPAPADRWISAGAQKCSRLDPAWRPFSGPLSPSSVQLALTILSGLFSWLVSAGYLRGNPLSLSRTRSTRSAPRITRLLDQKQWQVVQVAVARLPSTTPTEQRIKARARWAASLLYLTGLRISELAQNTMGSFFAERDPAGQVRWWLEVTGKGNKVRLVPAPDVLMAELGRYRESLGLGARPVQGESTPLVLALSFTENGAKDPRPLTRAALHNLIKSIFEEAAGALEDQGEPTEAVQHLKSASAHWLRHTAASRMAERMPLSEVSENLGHASLATTSIYVHAQKRSRHDSTSEHHGLSWDQEAPARSYSGSLSE